MVGRLVLASASMRLGAVLHHKGVSIARTAFDTAAEAIARIVLTQSMIAHARIFILADPAADTSLAFCLAAIALPHGPQAKLLKQRNRLLAA